SGYSVEEVTLENLRFNHGWLNPPLARALSVFMLTFVETEARGAAVVRRCVDLVRSVAKDDAHAVLCSLESLEVAIKAMNHVFYRNIRTTLIDPAAWDEWIKPIYGWGLDAGDGTLEGASGLQLGSIQCAEAILGFENETFLSNAAIDSRKYMPVGHRRFLSVADAARPMVPRYIREHDSPLLTQRYNACIDSLRAWRQAHRQRGALYLRGNGAGSMAGSTGMAISGCEHAAVDQFHALMQERIDETMKAHIVMA
ncbi:MAG: indoleamine 2,3-dioxygenase, partial [Chloroflexota bacterium]|nr:indoleamine 2,3-dioxygenase [Chloroflexota bacterium]